MRNEIIDECITKIKSLIKPYCSDHTPYWGPCVTCGNYTNSLVLPDLDDIIEELKTLKRYEIIINKQYD